jgi:hypothetical protein
MTMHMIQSVAALCAAAALLTGIPAAAQIGAGRKGGI